MLIILRRDMVPMGLRDTECVSLMYYMKHVLHYTEDEALCAFSKLTKYDDIYSEFSRVAFGYFCPLEEGEITIDGQTASAIRKCRNCSVLESYLVLVSLRDED